MSKEEVWTPAHETKWWTGYVTRTDQFYLVAKLEGARSYDPRYQVYVHHTTVADRFGAARIGMKVQLRLRPNRKTGNAFLWEATEAVLKTEDSAVQEI